MQRLKLINDTIFRNTKMRSLKVYDLCWSLTLKEMQKIHSKTRAFV